MQGPSGIGPAGRWPDGGSEPQASGAIAKVPEISAARALAWAALSLAVSVGAVPPLGDGSFGPVSSEGHCRLGSAGAGSECDCSELDARTRLALGLPLSVNELGPADLELLDGIGPARAAAIVSERESAGPFGSPAALAGRVAGIGPATAARLSEQLAGGTGSCESTVPAALR